MGGGRRPPPGVGWRRSMLCLPASGQGAGAARWLATAALLQLAVPGAHTLIQLLHRADEGAILLPEGRIVAAFLDQQRRNARPRCCLSLWRPPRPGPELLVSNRRLRCLPARDRVVRRRGDQ